MREHIEHLLAATGALAFALFISYFNTGAVVHIPALHSADGLVPLSPETTFSPSAFEGVTLSTSTISNLFPYGVEAALTSSSTVGPRVIVPSPKPTGVTAPKPTTTPAPVVDVPEPVVTPTPVTTPIVEPAPAPVAVPVPTTSGTPLATLRGSIVNILCTSKVPTLHGVSGSGVIIDSRGLILTVTHVAQMLVLSEYLGSDKISCVIRTGNPAHNAYLARPVYVSEDWIKANPTTLISSQPKGTGRYDYAVLAITGSAGSPATGAYPAMSTTTVIPKVDDTVYVGSYGSQGLSSSEVLTALSPTLTSTTLTRYYAFESGAGAEVMALAGNDAAKQGSSGGAIADENGSVIGIITTSETSGATSDREMRSITIKYIHRDFSEQTGKDFDSYFGDTSVTTLVNSYAPSVQSLGAYLAHAIGLE